MRILVDEHTKQRYECIGGSDLRPILRKINDNGDSMTSRLRDIRDYLECCFDGRAEKLTRHRQNVMVRKWICYIYTQHLEFHPRVVAALLGIDRCTVLYHTKDIEGKIGLYREYQEMLNEIKKLIEND